MNKAIYVNVYLCKYHKVVNPVSRHVIASYSTCNKMSKIRLDTIPLAYNEIISFLKRDLEVDIVDDELALRIIGRRLSENEYLKLSLD